jgi:hypothetical protein
MIDWLLVDYGETISTSLPASTVSDLTEMGGAGRGRDGQTGD